MGFQKIVLAEWVDEKQVKLKGNKKCLENPEERGLGRAGAIHGPGGCGWHRKNDSVMQKRGSWDFRQWELWIIWHQNLNSSHPSGIEGLGLDQLGLTTEACWRTGVAWLRKDGGTETPRWQTRSGEKLFGNGEEGVGEGRTNQSEALHSALTTTSSNH